MVFIDRAPLEFHKWAPHTFEPTRKKLALCSFSHVTWMQFLLLPSSVSGDWVSSMAAAFILAFKVWCIPCGSYLVVK